LRCRTCVSAGHEWLHAIADLQPHMRRQSLEHRITSVVSHAMTRPAPRPWSFPHRMSSRKPEFKEHDESRDTACHVSSMSDEVAVTNDVIGPASCEQLRPASSHWCEKYLGCREATAWSVERCCSYWPPSLRPNSTAEGLCRQRLPQTVLIVSNDDGRVPRAV